MFAILWNMIILYRDAMDFMMNWYTLWYAILVLIVITSVWGYHCYMLVRKYESKFFFYWYAYLLLKKLTTYDLKFSQHPSQCFNIKVSG